MEKYPYLTVLQNVAPFLHKLQFLNRYCYEVVLPTAMLSCPIFVPKSRMH
jgi:hypothetical protein